MTFCNYYTERDQKKNAVGLKAVPPLPSLLACPQARARPGEGCDLQSKVRNFRRDAQSAKELLTSHPRA